MNAHTDRVVRVGCGQPDVWVHAEQVRGGWRWHLTAADRPVHDGGKADSEEVAYVRAEAAAWEPTVTDQLRQGDPT